MYNLTTDEVLDQLNSSRHGLSTAEAKLRQEEHGKNEAQPPKKPNLAMKINKQLNNIVMFILIFAMIASSVAVILTHDMYQIVSIVIIFVVIVLNIIIGIVEDNKTSKAFGDIASSLSSKVQVLRNGKISLIKTSDLVVGDIVKLKAGDVVPADIRLIDCHELHICDVAITGVTMSVKKFSTVIEGKYTPIGDRNNMAYFGSSVTAGTGTGVVTALIKDSVLGKATYNDVSTDTYSIPLVAKLRYTMNILACVVLGVSVIGFILNLIRHNDVSSSFMSAVALAVCVIPETLLLSIEATQTKTMRNLKKLGVVAKSFGDMDKLAHTEVLIFNKSKLITLNKQTVEDVWVNNMAEYDLNNNPNFISLINCMLLCNDAHTTITVDNELKVIGSALEQALVNYGYKCGYDKENMEGMFPRVNEIPYDNYRKIMTTINTVGESAFAFVKGDFNTILSNCGSILNCGLKVDMSEKLRNQLIERYNSNIGLGKSVVAFAIKEVRGDVYNVVQSAIEDRMTFVGFAVISDPIKENVNFDLKELKSSNIELKMITNDDKETAFYSAKSLGLINNINKVVTGDEIEKMSDLELNNNIDNYVVFAKLLNGQKSRIVKAIKNKHFVTVTGDDVDDSDAISKANCSIALGGTGAEVIKQNAGIVVLNDDVKSITHGIKQCRAGSFNVIKMIEYLLSIGIAELMLVAIILIGFNKPFLSPALIICLNFAGGLLPSLGLGREKPEKNVLKQKLPSTHDKIFKGLTGANIMIYAVIQTLLILSLYFVYDKGGSSADVTVTMCFVATAFMQIFHSFNMKHELKSLFSSNPFNNKRLNLAFALSVILTFAFVGLPLGNLRQALGVTGLKLEDWLVCLIVGFLIIPISEIVKIIERSILKNKK